MNNLYAAVIHDVKNQLAELSLRLGGRGGAQAEMVIAMNASRRLSEMLLIYRQENELLSVNADSVSPADFVAILAAEFGELFPQLKIEVEASKAPTFSFFDDALVRMALANALHNACHSAKSEIKLSAYAKDKMLVLEVADDGPGYPEALLKSGGAEPSAASGRGTGLGLYLARKIAELHHLENSHGFVELSNKNGAVFRMMLP
ncbi:MAG: HAMP domain-containing sensor histidine kinase [Gallionellaceae bacterium]